MSSFVLSFDLGTSTYKAALYNKMGQRIAESIETCDVQYPQKGWAEQNPDKWWQQTAQLTQSVIKKAQIAPNQIAALSITTQMCGTIPIDGHGEVLSPAMIWLDTRSKEIAKKMVSGLINIQGYGLTSALKWLHLTNGAPNLSGKDPLSKILWLREHSQKIWARTERILDIKDFMLFRCTGQAVTSPDCAHLTWLMNSRTRQWSPTLLKKTKLNPKLLPEILPATSQIKGGLSHAAAKHLELSPNTPVIVGAGDIITSALGSGAIKNGAAHLYFGTSNWSAAHVSKRKVSPFTFIGTICSTFTNKHLLIAAQENAGSSLSKISEMMNLGNDPQALHKLAEKSVPGSNGLMFFPWLHGERCPVDDSSVRGGFLNLSLSHTRGDMARAAIEGVIYNQLWAAQSLFKMAQTPLDTSLPVLGGVAQSDILMQTLADVFNRPMTRSKDPQWVGAFGGFMCAAVSLKWQDSLETGAFNFETEKSFYPDPCNVELHEKRSSAFKAAYRNNKHWYNQLLS